MRKDNSKKVPKNITELILWKNKKDNFTNESVEEYNSNYTNLCGGTQCTDTLFSFLSLYAIGIYVFNKQMKDFEVSNKIYLLNREDKKKQLLASKKFISNLLLNTNQDTFKLNDLNNIFNKFAEVYFKPGNVIPMWPGGNMMKGNQNCGFYDNTSIFFHRFPVYYDMLNNSVIPTFFNEYSREYIMNSKFESLESLLKSMPATTDYEAYINECIDIINKRTDYIEEYIKNKGV